MSPKKLRKISHWELEISSYLFNISKEVSQLTDWHTYKKIEKNWNKCRKILVMSPQNFKKIYHQELEIFLYMSNFHTEVSQLKDWETYKKFKIIWIKCKNIQGISPKNFRKMSHPELDISLHLSNFRNEVSQLTDRQK